MASKALREVDAQRLLARLISEYSDGEINLSNRYIGVGPKTDLVKLAANNPWLKECKLVVKVDQLIKRRGINNLVLLNASYDEAVEWISERMEKEVTLDGTTGVLKNFVISEFVPHEKEDEYYCAIQSVREGDEILFYHAGGVDVGDVDSKAKRVTVGIWDVEQVDEQYIVNNLLSEVPAERQPRVATFLKFLFKAYVKANFSYLEINPLAFVDSDAVPLDLAAKLDDTAHFECKGMWGDISFSSPFGRESNEAERFVERLDANSGSSLKLTILNPQGRIWSLVAGGGASVIYADTVADLGCGNELANYGEYSGNPTEGETFEYTKTVLDLMTKQKDPLGREKVLLIGGGIANFTDVSKTFDGIIRALRHFESKLKDVGVKIYVRRGGPNYKDGLEKIRNAGHELGLSIEVYGPETHMTRIVKMALAA